MLENVLNDIQVGIPAEVYYVGHSEGKPEDEVIIFTFFTDGVEIKLVVEKTAMKEFVPEYSKLLKKVL